MSKIKELLDVHSIDVSDFYLDHICYRVEATSKYHELISNIEQYGILLSNSIVNGRPISTFKIENLANYFGQEISVLEIPFPKNNNVYLEGFEHVEFVIDCPLESFIEKHPKVDFDIKNINKEINPEVRLKSKDKKISIKFHCQSLEKVIEREKAMKRLG